MNHTRSIVRCLLPLALASLCDGVLGQQIQVVHPQGCAHGFVEVTTLQGTRVAVGDFSQRLRGDMMTSRLSMRFLDGSLDDETTIYRQGRAFHFISDHHIQRGPSFSKPVDVTIDAARSLVVTNDANGRKTQAHVDMPPEVYNGLATTLLMNWRPSMPEMKIAVVVAAASPRIVHLSIKPVGKVPVTIGGMSRTTTDYLVHVELGGVAGVIAPLLVREPLDHHVLILSGDDPAFIREEGTLYEGGPVLRIQQISAVFGD